MNDDSPGFLNHTLLSQPDLPADLPAELQPDLQPDPPPAPVVPAPAAEPPMAETTASPAAVQPAVPATEPQRREPPQGPNLAELMSRDPEAYHRHVLGEAERMVQTRILEGQLAAAAGRHGTAFDEAYEAVLQAGSAAVQECLARPDPGEAIVNWHKRHRILSGLPETFFADPDGWVRQRYAELAAQAARPGPSGAGQAAPARPAAPAAPAAPPPSLASAPGSAGAFQEQVPDSAFAFAFGH